LKQNVLYSLAYCAVLLLSSLAPTDAIAEEFADIEGDLVVFHAGSLSVPFREVASAFMDEYPKVRVLREAAGSRACARKITDLNRACDVLGSADYTVIDALLIPEHASWNIRFAANEMVIAYTEHSRRSADIGAENWHQILLESDVAYGRSDPNADPCGYRTVLTTQLAEIHYSEPGLASRLQKKDTRHIRPKETDLLALLEVGAIDYVFIYRSVAKQHALKWVDLPDSINLKSPDHAAHYAQAKTTITGPEPGTTITKEGEPMVYGITIPNNAPNPRAAQAFVSFLLEHDNGMAIMERNGQPSLVPTFSESYDRVPSLLKRFAISTQ